ncbi:M14 family metallopeptidase [Sulfurospirillum barnesii]|uniref:Putative deacylase n=1 Tax=Sulfurospirillum barnesii (strain ATCC 700032 / DSM 10660 / SES-3) TaxID=760154 RepID=I3XW27_SULBS|nr:M14 family metallopeptidase [Sulfurospirillum barnesii]AFL68151.1 putative deacylase [Sulfurospirillum barnesii SES-3]
MIEEFFSVKLPVDESLKLRRNRFHPHDINTSTKRISIITGTHGDELEGQYVCYLLTKWLRENPDKIKGIIDIYPSMNPMGIDSISRNFPFYDVDLNRTFPGHTADFLPAQVANAITQSVKGSDFAIDIHASNIFLKELPQVRISRSNADTLVPLAEKLGIEFIWVHDAVTVLESTFSHTLNTLGTKTLVVEMGVGMRISKTYGENLSHGILNLMAHADIIDLPEHPIQASISNHHSHVHFINASEAGIFIPTLEHNVLVKKGEILGEIIDPLEGVVKERLLSPCDGLLFTIREYPVVYEGSLLARILENHFEENA